MALLVLLYAMQGIPLGLTMGAMPFMLQAKLSMTQMGIFSISSYPYSFKLLWSPIVDCLHSRRFGRRKSWIVPIQLASAALLVMSASWIEARVDDGDVVSLTALFFAFVLLAATQDIAVDGWALTLLPPEHVEYASTCQTLGMNTGYFTSFTVFLALSNPEFCNKYARRALGLAPSAAPLVSLSGYVAFWGWAFAVVTILIAVSKKETERFAAPDGGAKAAAGKRGGKRDAGFGGGGGPAGGVWREVSAAYAQLWGVVRLRPIWALSLMLVTYRLGVLPAEGAAALKLLDKGVAKESLAALVLLQFPVELVSAVVAGRWASTHSPYHPFMAGYFLRLAMAAALTALAAAFPPGASSFAEHGPWFAALAGAGLVTGFTSTLMFTALGSFFNKISDPGMGGAYLTLLNTIANMGVILPKTPLFALMDALTSSSCRPPGGGPPLPLPLAAGAGAGAPPRPLRCPKKQRDLLIGPAAEACAAAGGECAMDSDGFYVVSYTMIAVGLGLGLFIMRLFPRLTRLPLGRWRARPAAGGGAPA
ncbi:MAG: acetyl-coenzyme A transporter 1-domain-containing protein [Monoraphidium minutum]|nr:MAG: acetyl-coenzyme A transporter 1-domain-containing protein [Monoraphidium minutum]